MLTTAMFLDAMEMLQKRAHDNAVKHGFWEGEENNNTPTKLMLLISEAAEWFEAFRADTLLQPCGKMMPAITLGCGLGTEHPLSIMVPGGEHRPMNNQEEEAADIAIRLLDCCEKWGIDLARCILAKMEYNETRPYRHGNKKV